MPASAASPSSSGRIMRVSTGPGATTFTRIPSGPVSFMSDRASPMTACLLAT